MDQQMKPKHKRRVSFSDVAQGIPEDYTRLRDIAKSESFNGKESDQFAATIAAAAYAIYSLEETRAEFERRMVESFREDPSARTKSYIDQDNALEIPDLGGLTRRSSRVETKDVGGAPMLRSTTRPIEISGSRRIGSARTMEGSRADAGVGNGMETNRADAWERARLAKISKWYEKTNAKIIEWEKEKKRRASLDMERRKAEIDRLKRINLSHYQNKVDRIEDVAGGARKQLEEKKRSEEAYAKQKARKIRTTGRVPVQCFCFEC